MADLIRIQLRRMRTAAGLSQEDFGKLAHYSASMVSAVELGQRPLDSQFLARADDVLKTDGLLVALLEVARRDGEPSWLRPWIDAEREAKQLRCYHPNLIPGLLQAPAYARSMLSCALDLSTTEVERRLNTRLQRQDILTGDNPPQFIAVIDETALRRFGEDFTELMPEQLQHLITCAELPHVNIHVVPAEALHVGHSGPFTLARLNDGGWVGHLETQLGGTVVEHDDEIATLLARWEAVRSQALPIRQSIELIKEVIEIWT